jgi:hypothetical protein
MNSEMSDPKPEPDLGNMNWAPMFFPNAQPKVVAETTKNEKYPADLPDIHARLSWAGSSPESRDGRRMRSFKLLSDGDLGCHFQRWDLPAMRQAHDDKDARRLPLGRLCRRENRVLSRLAGAQREFRNLPGVAAFVAFE